MVSNPRQDNVQIQYHTEIIMHTKPESIAELDNDW